MSSTAQNACMNMSKGESKAVTSNDLLVTHHQNTAVTLLPRNTAQQYTRENCEITSHWDTPLIKKFGQLYLHKVTP